MNRIGCILVVMASVAVVLGKEGQGLEDSQDLLGENGEELDDVTQPPKPEDPSIPPIKAEKSAKKQNKQGGAAKKSKTQGPAGPIFADQYQSRRLSPPITNNLQYAPAFNAYNTQCFCPAYQWG